MPNGDPKKHKRPDPDRAKFEKMLGFARSIQERDIAEYGRQKDEENRRQVNEFRRKAIELVKHKLIPTSVDEVVEAFKAMTSFEKQRLLEAEGTLVPEILVSLGVIPGVIQAGRDMVMEMREESPDKLGMAMAAAGMIPGVGVVRQGMKGLRGTKTELKTIKNALDNFDLPREKGGGGFTVNPRTGDVVESGYGVGAAADRTLVIDGPPTPERILEYMRQNGDVFSDPDYHIGGWFNEADGKTYLDAARVVDDKMDALDIGKATVNPETGEAEKAIYDIARKTEIPVDDAERLKAAILDDEAAALANLPTQRRHFEATADALPDVRDLGAAALAGRAKKGWYANTVNSLVETFGPDAPRFAAFLAALSPRQPVEENLAQALRGWRAWEKAGRPVDEAAIGDILDATVKKVEGEAGTQMASRRLNALEALGASETDIIKLSGPKVDAFYRNLIGDTQRVTIDTWMQQLANANPKNFERGAAKFEEGLRKGRKTMGVASGQHIAYSARVRETADYLTELTGRSWTPDEVQETAWSWGKILAESETPGSRNLYEEPLVGISKFIGDEQIAKTPDFATLMQEPENLAIIDELGLQRPSKPPAPHLPATDPAPDPERLANMARRMEQFRTGQFAFSLGGLLGGSLLAQQARRRDGGS